MVRQILKDEMNRLVIIRGGGDLATGVAIRLHRVGLKIIITELPKPLVVRRRVAFASAIYDAEITVEGVTARRVLEPFQALDVLSSGEIPVIADPTCLIRHFPNLTVAALVDARMTKKPPDLALDAAPLVIGLGPGFSAGANCHAVIETQRGHHLGRVIWSGSAALDTGLPGKIGLHQPDRVLRAPADGVLETFVQIGDRVNASVKIASVGDRAIIAPFDGVMRGLLWNGLSVLQGLKIGDIDPRNNPALALQVSDKAFAIGGGVLEALLTQPDIRKTLWN